MADVRRCCLHLRSSSRAFHNEILVSTIPSYKVVHSYEPKQQCASKTPIFLLGANWSPAAFSKTVGIISQSIFDFCLKFASSKVYKLSIFFFIQMHHAECLLTITNMCKKIGRKFFRNVYILV